jgi:tetratricopeptide (TPR) repeat protein
MDAAGPFPTDGQRRRALFYLDTLLSGGEDADLRLRRAALELLLREDGAALADAEAALARGKAPAPLLARALALRAAGRGEEAAADLAAAAALCRRGQGPALACANARRLSSSGSARTGTAWKEISAELAAAPSSASSGTAAPVTLSADPRLELLSAVWLLGRGAAADAELPSEVRPYAAEIRRRFSAQAAHPAVKRLARLLKEGKPPMAAAQLLLGVGAPPELSPVEVSYGGLGEEQTRAFLQELRDFARATRFAEFYAAHKAVYAGWRATAEKEARGGLRPADAAAYLKTAFTATRFILAPALPSSFGANLTLPGADGPEQLRMRSDMEPGMPGLNFDFNDFAAGVAHELVHTVTDPAGLSRREELQVYASLAGPRCADSWLGCVLEQVDIAVTLRVLRRERGEAAYQAMLGEYTAAGFPQLQALCERLQEYEAGGDAYPTFDSFYPRLVEVFREALERRVRDQARRGLAAAAHGSGPAAPGAPPADSVRAATFAVDERVELAAALLAAGAAPAPCAGYCAQVREKFAPFSGHPAAAAARALAESDPSGTLLPRLLLQVSPPPRLLPAGPLPADLTARAGGPKAVESFLEAARAFSADSGFSAFFAAHRDDYDAWVRAARAERDRGLTAREAAAYLGGDAPAPLRFLLSPALPAGRAARFTAVGRDGVERVVLRAASYPEGKGPAFGLDTEQGSAAQAAADAVVESMLPAAPAAAAGAAELARACRDPRAPLWPVCAREVLTRAVTRRVAALSGKTAGPAAAGAGDSLEPLVEAAAGKLLEYEAARDRYKSLRDFYPRLVEAFVPRAAVRKPGAARGAEPRVSFSVDPRVELFSVLRLLGGHEPAAPDAAPLAYERAARDWFAPYAGDPAVALAAAMTAQDPQRDLPLQLLFHLSPDAALAAAEPVPDGYASAAGGPQAVEAWFAAVRAFARRSRFFDFYAARKADYARFAEQARDEARRSLSLKALPAYLGVDLDSEYDFVLAPLLPESEATNFTLLADDSVREIRLRAGTNSDSRGLRFMFDSFGNSPAHELVHTVTNPLVARAPLTGAPPRGCNDAQGPTAWTGCVQEHLVYAVTLRLLAREQGEEAAAKVLQEYEGRGFPYLAPLCRRLKAYEAGRKKWPTLADFYPQLEAVFRAAPPAGAAALSGDGPGRSAKEEGVRAFLAGRVDEAVARFRAAVAAEPGDVEALADLGVALEKKGDAAAALESYDRAVAAGLSRGASDWEHTAAALSSRATLLSAEGRDADARRDLEKALTLSPPDWSGRAELASRLKAMKGARP